ncbi:hypothetical protein KY348_02255 [Candidatus Woesearchaeota archaeon]|nr:hypothetical protein [Candidatus Woesearchaeota archaeon]
MQRKIIKQGLGGCTVSLPIKWIRENKLLPGDEVEVLQKDRDILITGKGTVYHKKKEIHLKEAESLPRIRSILASSYKAGYDEIIIHAQNLPSIKKINNIINTFTGLEVVSQTKNTLRFKSFLQEDEGEVKNLIIKMFQTINSMMKNIIEDWDKVDLSNIQSLTEINIRKTRDHCLRIIHLTKYSGDKAYDYCVLITQLEKMAAQLSYLAECISELPSLDKELITDFQKDYEQFYHCYLKKDFNQANKLWEAHRRKTRNLFYPKALDNLVKKNKALAVHYYSLTMLLRAVASRILALSA